MEGNVPARARNCKLLKGLQIRAQIMSAGHYTFPETKNVLYEFPCGGDTNDCPALPSSLWSGPERRDHRYEWIAEQTF